MVRVQTFLFDIFVWPFLVYFINADGFHPAQIKKKPLHGPNNIFSCFRAKKGQKRHVDGQHGELRFFVTPQMLFFFIWFHFLSVT